VAGDYSRCPSGKSKTIRFISALFLLNCQSRSDANFSPARPRLRDLKIGRAKCLRLSAFVCGKFIKDYIANHGALLFLTPTFLEMIIKLLIRGRRYPRRLS
jgi:hypothetical protein